MSNKHLVYFHGDNLNLLKRLKLQLSDQYQLVNFQDVNLAQLLAHPKLLAVLVDLNSDKNSLDNLLLNRRIPVLGLLDNQLTFPSTCKLTDLVPLATIPNKRFDELEKKLNALIHHQLQESSQKKFRNYILNQYIKDSHFKNSLSLAYQPIYNFNQTAFDRFEVSMKWDHQPFKNFQMGELFNLLESKITLLDDITMQQFEEIANHMANFYKTYGVYHPCFINLCAYQLHSHHILVELKKILDQYQLPATLFYLQIHATDFEAKRMLWLEHLPQINSLGMNIAMKVSNPVNIQLQELSMLHVKAIKLQKKFIGQSTQFELETAFNKLSSTNIELFAEQVETTEQLEQFRLHDVNFAQGYLFKSPTTASEINNIVHKNAVYN